MTAFAGYFENAVNIETLRAFGLAASWSGACLGLGWVKEDPDMRIQTFVTTTALALLGTIAVAQSVTYDFDKATDFSKFKTYAWVRGTNLSDQLNHQRIVTAVDRQLSARGLAKVEAGANPDMLVAYHASFDRDLQINGFSSGWGGNRFGGGSRSGTARVEEILVGTLAVDVVNAQTRTIVWRGMATKEVDVNARPEAREKNINRAADKLFKNYPPKPAR